MAQVFSQQQTALEALRGRCPLAQIQMQFALRAEEMEQRAEQFMGFGYLLALRQCSAGIVGSAQQEAVIGDVVVRQRQEIVCARCRGALSRFGIEVQGAGQFAALRGHVA